MFKTKTKLLLIPYFWDRELDKKIKEKASKTHKVYLSEHLIFNNFSIITGFIGYPQILILLSSIENIMDKEIFFIGTAGTLNDSIRIPISVNITEIYSSSIYKFFSKKNKFPLKTIPDHSIKKGSCVSVDIPVRETKRWVKKHKEISIDFVEMELFPIRVFIQKPFTAIVIVTDIVKGDKIIRLMDIKLIKKEFSKSFNLITGILQQEKINVET